MKLDVSECAGRWMNKALDTADGLRQAKGGWRTFRDCRRGKGPSFQRIEASLSSDHADLVRMGLAHQNIRLARALD